MADRPDQAPATPRYVPVARRALPVSEEATGPDFEAPEVQPRRLAADSLDAEAEPGPPAPNRRYVLVLAAFTGASVVLVLWLVFGLAGGRVVWQMLVPLVPWALVLGFLWVQVARRAWARRQAHSGASDARR